jgi:hypothetical protein
MKIIGLNTEEGRVFELILDRPRFGLSISDTKGVKETDCVLHNKVSKSKDVGNLFNVTVIFYIALCE